MQRVKNHGVSCYEFSGPRLEAGEEEKPISAAIDAGLPALDVRERARSFWFIKQPIV